MVMRQAILILVTGSDCVLCVLADKCQAVCEYKIQNGSMSNNSTQLWGHTSGWGKHDLLQYLTCSHLSQLLL